VCFHFPDLCRLNPLIAATARYRSMERCGFPFLEYKGKEDRGKEYELTGNARALRGRAGDSRSA
jgi:hypothetical protein